MKIEWNCFFMPSTTTTPFPPRPPALPTHPGCLLYDLLMSPLDAAVPLKQVDSVAVHVPEHLNLHVSAIREQTAEWGGGGKTTPVARSQPTRQRGGGGGGERGVTWGLLQTSPPAWRRRWRTFWLLFLPTPAAPRSRPQWARYAFPEEGNKIKNRI